jgi:serine/threonine protein kinase
VPHICRYYGAWQDAAHVWIAMEHCSGGDLLGVLLKENRAFDEGRAVREVRTRVRGNSFPYALHTHMLNTKTILEKL